MDDKNLETAKVLVVKETSPAIATVLDPTGTSATTVKPLASLTEVTVTAQAEKEHLTTAPAPTATDVIEVDNGEFKAVQVNDETPSSEGVSVPVFNLETQQDEPPQLTLEPVPVTTKDCPKTPEKVEVSISENNDSIVSSVTQIQFPSTSAEALGVAVEAANASDFAAGEPAVLPAMTPSVVCLNTSTTIATTDSAPAAATSIDASSLLIEQHSEVTTTTTTNINADGVATVQAQPLIAPTAISHLINVESGVASTRTQHTVASADSNGGTTTTTITTPNPALVETIVRNFSACQQQQQQQQQQETAGKDHADGETNVQRQHNHPEHDVALLSEEQTNFAMDALQEASTMVIETEDPGAEVQAAMNTVHNQVLAAAAAVAAAQHHGEVLVLGTGGSSSHSDRKRKAAELSNGDNSHVLDGPEHEHCMMEDDDDDDDVDDNDHDNEEEDGTKTSAEKRRSMPLRVSWDERIKMLEEYKKEHGNLLIPIRYKKNPSLGKFVHNTREQYKLFHKLTPQGYKKKCSLTEERIQQLDNLGFVWSTERSKKQNEDWNQRFEQLKEYKEKHGDCLVPHGYEEDPSFAEWVHRQRTNYASMQKDDKPNAMIEDRVQKLTDLGFNFTVHSDKWMDHWHLLKIYKEKHGHCQVPTHFAENPKLGRWVHTQRHQRRLQLKGKKSCMTDERIELLNELGFSWEVKPTLERPRAAWQQRYEELQEFYETKKNFLVPADTQPHLHTWCHEQRQRLKNLANHKKDASKRMGPDRVKLLAELGFTKDAELPSSKNLPEDFVPDRSDTSISDCQTNSSTSAKNETSSGDKNERGNVSTSDIEAVETNRVKVEESSVNEVSNSISSSDHAISATQNLEMGNGMICHNPQNSSTVDIKTERTAV